MIPEVQRLDDAVIVEKPDLAPDLLQLALQGDQEFAVIEQDALEALLDRAHREWAQGGGERLSRDLAFDGGSTRN
jgi:hypothetical protein